MAKSRSFSIFLLKEGFDSSNSLKEDHNLGEPVVAENLPDDAVLYVADLPFKQPWWKSYWGIQLDLKQTQKGALIFFPVMDRYFVITFGHTYHKLKDYSYEHDFGLRTTLNAVNPDELKSTDLVTPESAKRERIQIPKASDLDYFDINKDESIIKKLTGIVKEEYKDTFTNVTGAYNLRISTRIGASDFIKFCEELLEIYLKEDFKRSFPDIQNIVPVNDPDIIQKLNDILIDMWSRNESQIMLSIPQIVNYDNSLNFKFRGGGRSESYDYVSFAHYKSYLERKGIDEVTIEIIKRHRLEIHNENEVPIHSFSIYRCLLYDCVYLEKQYHLCDGEWYEVDINFINKMKSNLDSYFEPYTFLLDCDVKKESEYNEIVANSCDNALCLDRKNISPSGNTQVEPCDVYRLVDDVAHLIHIKISTKSAVLSHLFNQGYSSITLLRSENASKEKLKELVNDESLSVAIDNDKYEIIYGIITPKDMTKKSECLPLFSRISLMRIIKNYQIMKVPCKVVLIKDNFDRN